MFEYEIVGLLPQSDEGFVFRSCVPRLQDQPELWADECPYPIPRQREVRVRLVANVGHAETCATA